MILPVVFYDYEASSPILRDGRGLRVSDNTAHRRISGPDTEETSLAWRK
jgi:hypothetical protein